MTPLWLVRHAPTHAEVMVGWTDIEADLSDRAALARLCALLPPLPILSSDLRRAVATADALAEGRARLPHDPRLREMHFGDWETRSHASVEAESPELSRAFWQDAGPVSAPGGESWDAMARRALAAFDDAVSAHPQGVIVVAHFGPILSAIRRATGETLQAAFARRVEPLSLTGIEVANGVWRARRLDNRP